MAIRLLTPPSFEPFPEAQLFSTGAGRASYYTDCTGTRYSLCTDCFLYHLRTLNTPLEDFFWHIKPGPSNFDDVDIRKTTCKDLIHHLVTKCRQLKSLSIRNLTNFEIDAVASELALEKVLGGVVSLHISFESEPSRSCRWQPADGFKRDWLKYHADLKKLTLIAGTGFDDDSEETRPFLDLSDLHFDNIEELTLVNWTLDTSKMSRCWFISHKATLRTICLQDCHFEPGLNEPQPKCDFVTILLVCLPKAAITTAVFTTRYDGASWNITSDTGAALSP